VNHQPALQRRIANLEKMVQVSRALSSAFDLQSLLQEIVHSIVELADCEASSILLIDQQTGELSFVAVCGSDFSKLKDVSVPRHGSIAGTIAETRQPLVVHRAQDDPRFFSHVDQVTGQSTTSLMGVPLEIGGRVIGVLQAVNKQADQDFDQEDVEALLIFASQAAAAIENTRLFEEQRQRLTEVLLLQEVLLTLSRFIRRDQLLEQLLVLLEEWLGYTNCAVLLFDRERSTLRIVESRGFPGQDADNHIIPVDEHSVSGRVALTHATVNAADVCSIDNLKPILPNSRSALSVPMICGEDVDLVGVISLESEQPGFFTERDERILATIGTQAAIGVRQAELYEGSQRANRLKQEFITTMSHELRTPMTVLIGYCDVLAAKTLGPVNDAQLQALQVIRSRADLLLRMLNDVLDFSKIASGELHVNISRANLVRATQFAIEKYRPYAERKLQTIATDIPLECQYVMADDQRLRQVLGHLIENAIKFSPERRPILVQASVYERGYVRVDIIDQGIGIRPEDMDILFEDFRQLDSSFTRDYGGAGMGLAVSKHLIELQGGMIWVESEFGQGSTFSFILPRPVSSDGQSI
jgi:signal transduction histidine kinase